MLRSSMIKICSVIPPNSPPRRSSHGPRTTYERTVEPQLRREGRYIPNDPISSRPIPLLSSLGIEVEHLSMRDKRRGTSPHPKWGEERIMNDQSPSLLMHQITLGLGFTEGAEEDWHRSERLCRIMLRGDHTLADRVRLLQDLGDPLPMDWALTVDQWSRRDRCPP